MTEVTSPAKGDPEAFVLRGQPPRVVRFRRNLLMGVAALGCVALTAVTWLGLRHPGTKAHAVESAQDNPDKAAETQKPEPDQLQALPKTYADVPAGVPHLGPPLPGDLGRPILEHEQAERSAMASPPNSSGGAVDKVRAAGLFFQVTDHATGSATSPQNSDPAVPADPASQTGLALDPDKDQNAQAHKLDFVDQRASGSIYNGHHLQAPASPYQVMAGTVISASLITGLDSDLPGVVIAQVTAPVYDTVSGRFLLIPQGSRLIGQYDSVVAFGQSRALLVWQRLILPDGASLEIDNLPATDASGYTGLADKVDYHTWSLIKGIGLSTLLGITAQQGASNDNDLIKALRDSARQSANQAGQKIVEKTLNVQPGLKVRPGWPLRVIVHKDLILKPYGS